MDLRKAPPTWEIAADDGEAKLRIGARWLVLRDIERLQHQPSAEVNGIGHLVAAGSFIGLGVLFLLPVLAGASDFKFLIGALLFTAIGLTALCDLFRGQAYWIHRVEIGLADGRHEHYASTSENECLALIEAVEAVRGRVLA